MHFLGCFQAQVIAEAENEYKKLLEKLEPSIASQYQTRCETAVIEGKAISVS